MNRLIDTHEINEFEKILNVPPNAINDEILSNVKKLDEKQQIEPFLRQIINDLNETAHGPTEIADILTTNIHLNGKPVSTAFVLKGKSFEKVTSRIVAHQFAKLRTIPDLGLMVFLAVGNISDDAKRDFYQTAKDANCAYLIINAIDLARLLITYEKLCPIDGTPYEENGECLNGHSQDEGINIVLRFKEKPKYELIGPEDFSTPSAKRYAAKVLLDRHYSKDVLRALISEIINEVKIMNHYRNDKIRLHWGKTNAHVVLLYLAYDLKDIQNANWVCITSWINGKVTDFKHPFSLENSEDINGIKVSWNHDYESRKEYWDRQYGSKEEVLGKNRSLLNLMIPFADKAIDLFKKYQANDISEDKFILNINKLEPKATLFYHRSGEIPLPPHDCIEYDKVCQYLFATMHNIFLLYSSILVKKLPSKNREYLMGKEIEKYQEELKHLEYEESKIT